jgi:hypothetical protein
MFCPNCGTADQNSNAYCRRCGLWLSDQNPIKSRTASRPEDKLKAMLIFNGLSAVFALTSAIALYATYLGTPEGKWSVYVAGAFCLVVAVYQTVSFFYALQFRRRFKRGREGSERTIEPKTEGLQYDGGITAQLEERPSVTENTTELLEAARKTQDPSQSKMG